MTSEGTITVRAFRFDPSTDTEPRFAAYEIPVTEPISVMVLMRTIHEMDPTFACRMSMCFKGACGSCLVAVNGEGALGCSTLIRPGDAITLEPHRGYELIRDIVVDFARPSSNRAEAPE